MTANHHLISTPRLALLFIPVVAFLMAAATKSEFSPVTHPSISTQAAPPDVPTQVQMRNVDFYVDPRIPLRIRRLSGTMRSRIGGPVTFDDKKSFTIDVVAAEVGLTGPDLSLLLNKYVFNYPGSPLSRLAISMSGNQIVQKGTLHKVAAMPFEIRATLSITPDGRIRIHPTRTEILGLHVDGLMKGLGLALDELISLKKAKGASLSGNDIFLSPTVILPPPEIQGRVSWVRIERDQVVMTFGSPATTTLVAIPDSSALNYMYYRGGTLKFGKLMMLDAEMLITDLDPADAFRFDLDRYQPQLIAGYSRTLPSGGLLVYMRDIDKLGKGTLNITTTPNR
ncbi:MAG: hypothetical protein ABI681_11715 [Gemmatimonadales bacterium]